MAQSRRGIRESQGNRKTVGRHNQEQGLSGLQEAQRKYPPVLFLTGNGQGFRHGRHGILGNP